MFQEVGDFQRQVDAGLVNYDGFLHEIAERAGVTYAEAKTQIENNIPNEPLFDYIRDELRPSYKLALLSNAGANWLDELFEPDQVKLFDEVALSFETGFVKPDVRAYELIVRRLGFESEECVFVDDLERYTTGAAEIGMKTVWYRDFEQLKTDLSTILAADPNN